MPVQSNSTNPSAAFDTSSAANNANAWGAAGAATSTPAVASDSLAYGGDTSTASSFVSLSAQTAAEQAAENLALFGPGEAQFSGASGASTGDPHLSFDGSNTSGNGNVDNRWDDMGSHADLLDAGSSFQGGYVVSTTATGLNANNVAYNKSATITTGNGQDTVTMGSGGAVTVSQNGQNLSLDKGKSIALASGAVVSEAQDGSVTVTDGSAAGSNIATTLKWNGLGVDVSFTSHQTYLGGDLVDQTKGIMA